MRRAFWVAGTLAAIAVASSTKAGRDEASARIARWNPLWIAIDIVGLFIIFMMIFGPRAS
jgi:hypothetical protein